MSTRADLQALKDFSGYLKKRKSERIGRSRKDFMTDYKKKDQREGKINKTHVTRLSLHLKKINVCVYNVP